jgi:hypothetical protein
VIFALAICLGASPSPAAAIEIYAGAPIFECKVETLEPGVEALLRPVLLPMAAARRARRDHDKAYVTAFEGLLESSDKDALEAQVALMAYYVGEHYGEELLASVLNRARRADSLVEYYAACRPRTSFEQDLGGVMVLKTLYTQYREERH